MNADQDRPTPDARPRWSRLWPAALLMALVVGGLWAPNLLSPPPPAWTVYNNVKGQIRRIVLADKSVLQLNGAGQVQVVYEDDDRRAAMGQAEAAFTVTRSEDRPFRITSGDRVIGTPGGELNILRQTSQNGATTVLTIRRGRVRVYPPDRAAEGIDAAAGEEVSWTDGQDPPQTRKVNADNAFAWQTHRLAYDKAPLSQVVADLNRYVARPIRVVDPSLAGLPYTGVLNVEGEDMMLKKLAVVLPIQAKPSAAEILLQKPVPKPPKPPKPPKKANLVQSLLKPRAKTPAKPELLPVPPPRQGALRQGQNP